MNYGIQTKAESIAMRESLLKDEQELIKSSLAPNRADLISEAICKARHQVVFTKTDSDVASGLKADIKCWTYGYAAYQGAAADGQSATRFVRS